jgi:hypothetical protein
MGNAFDKDKEGQGHHVQEEEAHFSKKELDAVNVLFGRITASLAGKSDGTTKSLMVPRLQRYLFLSGALKTREKFTEFLEHSMRMNGFQTIATMWELVKFGDDKDAGKTVPAITGFERLRRFLELLVSLTTRRPESDDTTRAVNAEVELLLKAILGEKTNTPEGVTDAEASLALRSWCSTNGPAVAKVFVSYLSDLCFPDDKHPSFHPYKAPHFVGDHAESVILPGGACDLIPLSLYSDKLQGDFRKLYSTMVDGRSFATMTHNIMGYEVTLTINHSSSLSLYLESNLTYASQHLTLEMLLRALCAFSSSLKAAITPSSVRSLRRNGGSSTASTAKATPSCSPSARS